MKKVILSLALFMACTLSACSLSGQNITSSNATNQSSPMSAASSIPEAPASSQGNTATGVAAVYAELLDTYVTALNEKWDGSALMKQGLNLLALDLYDGAPLNNIGYAVLDIDGNGTEELVIGTTANVTDGFYGKVIFDLYTLGQDNACIQVFSSSARNRYFYAGGQLFVDLGSSSADDSTNATMAYADMGLTDMGKVTDPASYLQMELIPLSQWGDSASTSNKKGENSASAELVGLLDEINKDVTIGATGSYMAAVPIAVKLLNWGVGTEMTTDVISMAVIDWMAPKGNDELVAFSEKMSVIDEIYQALLGEDAKDLLSSTGCDSAPYPWSDQPIETIETIMNTIGLR